MKILFALLLLTSCAPSVESDPAPEPGTPVYLVEVPAPEPVCPYRGEQLAAVAPYCTGGTCVWSDTADLFPDARRCDCATDLPADGPGDVPPECGV